MSETPGDRVVGDRYRLIEPIGRGGMGRVWTARDLVLDRMVAVKEVFPPPHLDADERRQVQERTLREARAAAGLNSVAAVTVHDVLDEGGRSWIVMELLDAPTLAETIRESGPLDGAATIAVGLALLDALEVAHAAGVLHRDVKPANVMLTQRGAVLTDFGIAHRDGDPGITTTGVVLGSAAYLAPERARGEPAGTASDLWSVGATLFAAVEGHGPFERDGQLATLHAVVSEPAAPPARAGVLAALLTDLLSKHPAERPTLSRAREMLEGARDRLSEGAGDTARIAATGPPHRSMSPDSWDAPEPVRTQDRPAPAPAPASAPAPAGTRRTSRVWTVLAVLVVLAGLAAAAVLLAPGLGGGEDDAPTAGEVPAPFESATLYEFARYLFDADQCEVPEPGDFPVADEVPDAELVKCLDGQYSGTFSCKDDEQSFLADRAVYLDAVVTGTRRPVPAAPAGQDEPADGIQVAFNHGGSNDARVYWDSPASLCAGELQVTDDDVAALVEYWEQVQTS